MTRDQVNQLELFLAEVLPPGQPWALVVREGGGVSRVLSNVTDDVYTAMMRRVTEGRLTSTEEHVFVRPGKRGEA